MQSSNFLNVASGHVNSLIDYVLDVKPYHTKLRQVVEEYVFQDSVTFSIEESRALTVFLGADILDRDLPAGNRPYATSWHKELRSNGVQRTFQLPLVSHPKFLSHAHQHRFTAGVDDDQQIKGLVLGSAQSPHTAGFSQRRWDGPGITLVTNNERQLHEGWNFVISHGVFSFEVREPAIGDNRVDPRWKESNVTDIADIPEKSGILRYGLPIYPVDTNALNEAQVAGAVYMPFGTISEIKSDPSKPVYREWILRCLTAGPVPTLEVNYVNDLTGLEVTVGIATFNVPFSYTDASSDINFIFKETLGDPPATPPLIEVGDEFILTPAEKLTIHPTAEKQTWSLVKVNPARLISPVTFLPAVADPPALQLHNRDLHLAPESYWTITFIDAESYEIHAHEYDANTATVGAPLAGYPKTVELINGCSYKDELIHFTLIPTSRGFLAGDQFYFTLGRDKPTFFVFGSESGWAGRAEVGKWFWNGQIGFKVPELQLTALAYLPTISTSPDASAWETVISSDQILTDVVYVPANNGFLVSGTNSIVASSLNGFSWASDIVALAQDGQRAIVIGENGFIAMTSLINVPPLAYEWFRRDSRTTSDLNAITFIDGFFISPPPTIVGLFVVVGDDGTIITSANGHAWMVQTSGTTQNLNSVTWKGSPTNIIVVVGNGGTILTSTDALTWTLEISGTSENLNAVEYLEDINLFVATGNNGTLLTSPDGITWTQATVATSEHLLDLAYQPITLPALPSGKIVVIGHAGAVLTSTDAGLTWTVGTGPILRSIAFGISQELFVGVGGGIIPTGQYEQLAPVHPMAEPSVYTIRFVNSTNAVVRNNIYGTRAGLVVNEPWQDEFVKFKIFDSPISFNAGDVIKVFISPVEKFLSRVSYDEIPYELPPYDLAVALFSAPRYHEEVFPLTHSHGTVIIGDFNAGDSARFLNVDDELVIDKAYFDIIQLRLPEANPTLVPELALTDGWLPLEFRYFDRIDTNNVPTSPAEFSDLTTRIEAYLASDPSYLVFYLDQPRYKCTNRNARCTLTFSEQFLNTYLLPGVNFTLRVIQEQLYGQTLRVKCTENISIAARLRMFLFDGPLYANDNRLSRGPFELPINYGSYNFQFSQTAYDADVNKTDPASWYPLSLVTSPHPHPFSIRMIAGTFSSDGSYDVFPYDFLPYDESMFTLGRTGLGIVPFSSDPGDRPWLRFVDGINLYFDLGFTPALVDGWHQPGNFTQVGQYRTLTVIANPLVNDFPLEVADDDFLVVHVNINGGAPLDPTTDYSVDLPSKTLTLTTDAALDDVLLVSLVVMGPSVSVYQLDTDMAVDENFTAGPGQTDFMLSTPPPYAVVEVQVNGVPVNFTVDYATGIVSLVVPATGGESVDVILYEFTQT